MCVWVPFSGLVVAGVGVFCCGSGGGSAGVGVC